MLTSSTRTLLGLVTLVASLSFPSSSRHLDSVHQYSTAQYRGGLFAHAAEPVNTAATAQSANDRDDKVSNNKKTKGKRNKKKQQVDASPLTDAEIAAHLKFAADLQPQYVPDYTQDINGMVMGRVGLVNSLILAYYYDNFSAHFRSKAMLYLQINLGTHWQHMMQAIDFLLRQEGADPNLRDAGPACHDMPDRLLAPNQESVAIYQCGATGITPLHYAAIVLDIELARLLVSHGARPDTQLLSSRTTPLHLAQQEIILTHLHQLLMNVASKARARFRETGKILKVDSKSFEKLGPKFQLGPLQNLLQLIKGAVMERPLLNEMFF